MKKEVYKHLPHLTLKILLIILVVVILFTLFYLKDNLKTSGSIIVQGDSTCQNQTTASLKYLQNKAPSYYDMVEKYIGIITCVESGSGIDVFERPPRFRAGRATREAGVEWYAGSIVHDACHVLLFEDYKKSHPFTIPPAPIWSGEVAEKKCIEIQTKALTEAGAPDWVFESIKKAAQTKYWEGDRWW